jgi:hypothetical protein
VTFDQSIPNKMILIPDELDYKENIIDHYIKWVAENDIDSSERKRFQVKACAEIEYFQRRKEELAAQFDSQLGFLHDEEGDKLPKELENHKTEIGTGRTVDELAKVEQNVRSIYEQRMDRTARRYEMLQGQCDERIRLAKQELTNDGNGDTTRFS